MKKSRILLKQDNEEYFDDKVSPIKRADKQRYPQQIRSNSFAFKSKCDARTANQKYYLQTLSECDITIAHGPAGSGKTWLVTRHALEQLVKNNVDKIIVTKPILEAGDERIGFLKGGLDEKIAPHFQSVLDCFEDHIGPAMAQKLIDSGKIIFQPVAYCRGRTFKNSFMIIDEAQNLTRGGVKLVLTRLGEGSQIALNGDSDQVDLPNKSSSGLDWVVKGLTGKSSLIGVVEFTKADNQRHPLVEIILSNLN